MSNFRMGRGLLRPRGGGNVNRLNTTQFSERSTTPIPIPNTDSASSNNDTNQPRVAPQSSSGVVRHRGNRNQTSNTSTAGRQPDSNDHNQHTGVIHQRNRHPPSARPSSRASYSTTENPSTMTTTTSQPRITHFMLTNLLEKSPDQILAEMLHPHFQLQRFLNDRRMRNNYDWILSMTALLEKLTECKGSNERIVMILKQLPGTPYIEGVYDEVRKLDSITDQLHFNFIQSFLRVSIAFLSMIPYSADDLTKIFERIELQFTKNPSESSEFVQTKVLLDEVLDLANEIDRRKHQKQQMTKNKNPTSTGTTTTTQHNAGPPPDDYRQLPIIPGVTEILSEQRTYLRENIVDGVYKDPEHYLDIHFRLLREDFVGPLRDGIQQYLSGAEGKNFNVRIYENVRSYGPRLSSRSGIVYDLCLDPTMASKISWANSRRLIYGNLLVLTFDRFQSCVFVTVEDRAELEKNFIISVKPLEKLNNDDQIQINLDEIDMSCPLTMIETMTYFEAYRPVLNALQSITADDTFPLAPFLLQLTNQMVPPDYITASTTYDFTPLLVDPNSEVKAKIVVQETTLGHPGRRRGANRASTEKDFRITYQKSNQVEQKYKSVAVLNQDQWPTSDQLHLNPKQREALILALTNKVALIQGPPGTGKTFLGVRITEMLLHNRSVWCPANEQSTPILMICHTNHALDQFLELIIKRLNLNEGIIRVGNRCQNPAIQQFSLLNARRFVRDNRLIPGSIYHQKHTILDRKTEAEEALKIHEHKIMAARTYIAPLSAFLEYDIIDQRHISSLSAPYNDRCDDFVLLNWLGLGYGYGYEQVSEDLISLVDLEAEVSTMNLNANGETKQTTDQEEKPGDKQAEGGEEKVESQEQENAEKEMNEEEEEEQRRRDELGMEEEYFIKSAVEKPNTTVSDSMNDQALVKDEDDDDGQEKWQEVRKRPYDRRRLIRHILQYPTTLTDQTVTELNSDVWQLSAGQRHDLYRYWLLNYQQYLHYHARDARREYNQAAAALAEYHQEEDYYILKDSVIVAMTTTCAAKYNSVLEKLQSKIVIVEEAAAIFEAHIITALSTKCEHLILIGDHVQLRPNPSVYRLAMKYHIDVSLFERFVKNNFPNVRLNIQHRMRPEIARLMRHFYDDLDDHISVKTDRPSVRAVESSVFFINHNNPETTVVDGSSKRNEFEAKYVVALAQYLIKQGYQAEQITILVMYLGQRQFIARQAKAIKILQGIRIMVTDNYQGEENDIIILSLVRSNAEKKIGFLKIHNRICVALSRARCGLFVIGNMNLLAEVEEKWKGILKSLVETNEVGKGLCLSCRQHSKEKFYADKPEAFGQRPEGGCHKTCDARLKCGHQCELMCHNYDFEHKDIVCRKKCNERLSCGHPCTKRCHVPQPTKHDPCRVPVDKTVAPCGHKIRFQCALTPTVADCSHPVLKRLPCDHAVEVPCRIASSPSELQRYSCPIACDAMLACKHKCSGKCGDCRTGRLHVSCAQKCGRELICSHVCKDPCASNCPPCLQNCQTRCVHSQCKKKCGELCIPCREPCIYQCKHLKCTRLCSEPCNRGPCNEPCDKKLKCGHDCIGICGEPCPRQCRICNKHIVQEIFFGSEDEGDARFVFLPDCKHLIEVTALDKFVQDFVDDRTANKAIRFPECPRCKQKIRRCTRYMPIINQVNNLIAQVKKKILGNQSKNEINQRQKSLIKEYEQTESNIKEIDTTRLKIYFSVLDDPDNFFTDDILILMKNILLFVNEIDKLLIDGRKKLPTNIFDDFVRSPLFHMVTYLLTHRKYRNFAEQQIKDIQAELERIRRLIYIEALVSSLKQTLKQNEQDGIDSMQHLTKKTGPFTTDDQQKFDALVKRFEHLNNIPGLGITERERVAIVTALNMAKGHWYVCPQGHPYVIGDCGGANQESKCPECGAQIGGQNHQLLTTNRHFGLMDDSQHAAWSDEANLDIGQPLI